MADLKLDPRLKQFATPRQAEYVDAVNAHGSYRAAEKALGMRGDGSTIGPVIKRLQAKEAEHRRQEAIAPRGTDGFVVRELTTAHDADGNETASWVREGPEPIMEPGGEDAGPARDGYDGYMIKGVSTYFGAGGEQRGQWVKTKIDDVRRAEMMREAVAAMCAEIQPVAAVAAPPPSNSKLLNLFTLTDAHIGALAWHREGGADWDLKIAEETILGAFRHMIATAPRAQVAVVAFLGDVMHQDSNRAMTPAHGHLLDADSRPRKIVGAVIRIMRQIIAMALASHDRVHVVVGEGNHDEYTSGSVLPEMFEVFYEEEPRVEINDSRLPYYVFQWGNVMLGWHHGHKKPPTQLPIYFATAHAKIWGNTTKRYAHLGHRHHVEEKEHSGMKTIQHSTLAARDAHASRGGWFSERQAFSFTYHAEFGEVARQTVTPEMLA